MNDYGQTRPRRGYDYNVSTLALRVAEHDLIANLQCSERL